MGTDYSLPRQAAEVLLDGRVLGGRPRLAQGALQLLAQSLRRPVLVGRRQAHAAHRLAVHAAGRAPHARDARAGLEAALERRAHAVGLAVAGAGVLVAFLEDGERGLAALEALVGIAA